MAAATSSSSPTSLLNSLSSLSLSSSPPPPPTTVSLSSTSSSTKTLTTITQPPITPLIHNTSNNIHSLLYPSLAYSYKLFFKTPYNVQVIVGPDESEESLIGRFRREVFRANIIQECKRRRFFETNQEMRKRKIRDAARRRSRRRQRPVAKKDEIQRKKVDDEPDNWELIDVEVPYCQ
ncbi:putative ribosomal protein S21 [Helianthus annuus]|uniref:Ribosomal protein S21 n=1 Tax=Helianthus annuus TaxID=4232 RepID=A0A251UUT8_HELAN|nr:30S ribosomal protein S21, chloroplastic [Helianthus annuus]KAF5807031.1 putative ribosomal protein S21 [Helianthus annuus]KAJ0920140.1 putative ribosomal protein S21 [Helianthus annuus]